MFYTLPPMQIENSINKGVADLSTVMATLNLVQTAGMREELQQAVAAVVTAGVPLEIAQAEDVKVRGTDGCAVQRCMLGQFHVPTFVEALKCVQGTVCLFGVK